MGGCSYDRDVYGSSSGWGSSGGYASSVADTVMSATMLDSSMFPLDRRIKSSTKHPIVIMLDVTGSNTNFAKIVYDKMPMFFGQIEQKGYLKDFEISVCAIGDAYSDDYPLQIADFAKGTEIDDWLSKLVLEGCGGGQRCETYELGAYYLLNNFDFDKDSKPIVFFLGDESPYKEVSGSQVKQYINSKIKVSDFNYKTFTVFKELLDKIPDTYVFLNPYCGKTIDKDIIKSWTSLFENESHVINMQPENEKAIVDLMLGVIALISEHDLEDYKIDMLDRGQTKERIESVDKTLLGLSKSLVPSKSVNGLVNRTSNIKRNKNTRL